MVPVNNCMSIQLNVHTFPDCTFVECNMNIPHVAVFCNQADINGPSFCCKHHSVVLADSVVKINVNAMVVDRIKMWGGSVLFSPLLKNNNLISI